MNLKLDHVGWGCADPKLFESFWVDLIGYKFVYKSDISPEMSLALFGTQLKGFHCLYKKDGLPTIQIHYFENLEDKQTNQFGRIGLNHVCFHTGLPGSRKEFLSLLPEDFTIITYDNPRGWVNIIIRDYEGNWIELLEDLKE